MLREGKINGFVHDLTHRGVSAWILSGLLFAFCILLFFTERLTPVAQVLHLGNKWTLYGVLYTLAIVAGGIHVIRKYSHNRYQIVRTSVVMFVQVVFAFAVPQILKFFHQPEYLSTRKTS
jgi:ferredoxin-type protein NapH